MISEFVCTRKNKQVRHLFVIGVFDVRRDACSPERTEQKCDLLILHQLARLFDGFARGICIVECN
jgi:hypothetical protein